MTARRENGLRDTTSFIAVTQHRVGSPSAGAPHPECLDRQPCAELAAAFMDRGGESATCIPFLVTGYGFPTLSTQAAS